MVAIDLFWEGDLMEVLKYNLVSVAFGLMALAALYGGLDGWGWFLVPCIITIHTKSSKPS